MDSLKGHLLIAAPQLGDPNFVRTVILMIDHDENGAFGIVLNRPSGRTVKEVWDELDDSCECLESINIGGPVVGPLLALHTQEYLAEAEVLPGLYLTAERENLDELVRQDYSTFRLFSGYSGWGEGQLEGELEQGGWITLKAKKEYVFVWDDDLWDRVGEEITQDVYRRGLKIKQFPTDPSLN
ncbi:MAG: YqgE/AlgH family protein [Planctomycetota bacterium]|nr:YqgE/AlgH family protein [Planctomycetota bacterium]